MVSKSALLLIASLHGVNAPRPPVPVRRAPASHVDARVVVRTIEGEMNRVAAQQRPDGSLDVPTHGGPFNSAMSLAALGYLGKPAPTGETLQVVRDMMRYQRSDGSFAMYEGGPASKSLTRLVLSGVRSATRADPRLLPLGGDVRDALARAEHFVERGPGTRDPAPIRVMVGMVTDLVDPGAGGAKFPPNVPVASPIVSRWLSAGVSERFARNINGPLASVFALLSDAKAERHASGLTKRVIGTRVKPAQDRLEQSVRSMQDEEGAFIYTSGMTALYAMALRARGASPDDPALVRAAQFLHSRHRAEPDGSVRPRGYTSSTWDTAAFLQLASPAGDVRGAAKALVQGQLPSGQWGMALHGNGGLADIDTAGVVLTGLSQQLPNLKGPDAAPVQSSIRRGVVALLGQQQKDGGFGAFGSKGLVPYGKRGPRIPTESVLNDASSPDVTGRALTGLLAVREHADLDAASRADVHEAIGRARGYLLKSRSEHGGWWSRWSAGHLSGAGFVTPPLRVLGESPDGVTLQTTRRFLLGAQLKDGGWGESVEVDLRPSRAGTGLSDSTPLQTAFGIIGLIASSDGRDPDVNHALRRGVHRLLESRGPDGSWSSRTALYTQYTGFDYYDAPGLTQYMVVKALRAYRTYENLGPDRAMRELVLGRP